MARIYISSTYTDLCPIVKLSIKHCGGLVMIDRDGGLRCNDQRPVDKCLSEWHGRSHRHKTCPLRFRALLMVRRGSTSGRLLIRYNGQFT
jgi:hypothetical protein